LKIRGRWNVLFAAGGLALAVTGSQAQEKKLALDPAKSEIHYMLGGTLHTVHGTFHVKEGEVTFNPADGHSGGSIVVDALSGNSGDPARDNRMHKEVLKSSEFQTVTFAPTGFTGTFNAEGDSTLKVHGMFTLLGQAHAIDVPMQVKSHGGMVEAKGSFEVPYVMWGLKNPSNFVLKVSKEVQVELALVGSLK